MNELPDDCLLECFSYLDYIELSYFRIINLHFNVLCIKCIIQRYRVEYSYTGIVTDITGIINHYRIRDWMDSNKIKFTKEPKEAKEYFDNLPAETIPYLREIILSNQPRLLIIYGEPCTGKSEFIRLFHNVAIPSSPDMLNISLAYISNRKMITMNDSKGGDLFRVTDILLRETLDVNETVINNDFKFIVVLESSGIWDFLSLISKYDKSIREKILSRIKMLSFDHNFENYDAENNQLIRKLQGKKNNQIFSILGPLLNNEADE